MHISGSLNTKKVDIESGKVDIQNKKLLGLKLQYCLL